MNVNKEDVILRLDSELTGNEVWMIKRKFGEAWIFSEINGL